MRNIPIITRYLLLINVAVYCLILVTGGDRSWLYGSFSLFFFKSPLFSFYQPFTYMFMHGGFQHLLFNMFALWMFGGVVEREWGPKKYLFYYISCGIGAGLVQEAAQWVQYVAVMDEPALVYTLLRTPTVGASGAIYALLLAFGMLYPEERIFIFPIPIPIKGKWFVMIYAGIELFSALAQTGDGVAHLAHLGGMAFGYFMIRHWRKQQSGGYRHSQGSEAFSRMKDMLAGKRWKQGPQTGSSHSQWSSNERQADWDYNAQKRARQEEIDRILDKIRKSGYDSLTSREKQTLFDQSQQK